MLSREIGQICQRGSGASRFPGSLTEEVPGEESAPHRLWAELSKELERTPGGASEEAQVAALDGGSVPCCLWELWPQECNSSSTGPRSQGAGGLSPGSCAALRDRRRLGVHKTVRTLLPPGTPSCADQRSPTPGASRPVWTGRLVVTGGADSRAGELATATAIVPCVTLCHGQSRAAGEEGPHRINSSH